MKKNSDGEETQQSSRVVDFECVLRFLPLVSPHERSKRENNKRAIQFPQRAISGVFEKGKSKRKIYNGALKRIVNTSKNEHESA